MIFNKLPKSVDIGYEGEQNSRPLELDISEGLAKWAGSVPTLLYIRPGENLAVPASTALDDGILTWIPDAYATEKSGGNGALQIVFTIEATNTVIGKSQVIPMTVNASLIESEDPPEPYESWIASLLAAAAEAEGSAQDAEAWAVGERGGADVGSSDPAYHNNAKYYAEQAAESAEEAAESAEEASKIYAPAIRAKASGAVAHFTDGAVAVPMALDIAINPKQAGSGDPSPTNIRPISGYTSVTVTQAGRNLLNDTATYPQTNRGVTATKNSDGSITLTGGGTGTSDSIITAGYTADLHLVAGGRYILSGCPSGGSSDTYRLMIAPTSWTSDTGAGVTFTAPTGSWGSSQIRIVIKRGYTFPTGGLTFKPMIRYVGDTGNPFEPYNSTDYEITMPNGAGTVYGGNLHINQDGSGVLTVTQGYIASYAGETLPGAWISDRDVYASGTTPTTGAQVVYALATSIPYPFTAMQISSLLGENSIWADTGDVTAEYTADTKTYIERLTQPDQDWIADAGISSGEYFMVGNELYIATDGIAAGETITPGENCTKKSLAEALNAINA